MTSQIIDMGVAELSRAMAKGDLSSKEITEAHLEQISEEDIKHNAFLAVTAESALNMAKEADLRRAKKINVSSLMGIPAGIKDNICTKGITTTCASKILEGFVPAYDATVVQKLKEQGVVLLGKLNMDEFAMGSGNENSAFSPVNNPVSPDRVPGGSSGGSAAAVASRCTPFALGSDTGGSIRQPAAFCGVVGMKPSYGRVSRYGLVAFASSLDQIGPLTRDVTDCAIVLSALCGHDPLDSTSVPNEPMDFTSGLQAGVKKMKIALPKELLEEGIAPDIQKAVQKAAAFYETMGAKVEVLSMPLLKSALPAYYVISSAEASSNLARFDGVRYGFRAKKFDNMESLYINTRSEGFGAEVKRRIMLGTFVLSAGYYDAYYKKALQVRSLISREFQKVFDKYDLILTPTTPTTAWKHGEKNNPLEAYLGDICTVSANIAGLPALSLPFGSDSEGLPIGIQLMGKIFDEKKVLQAAWALEKAQKEYAV